MANGYPRIIAHRGGGALAPENSLEGIALAARLGCRGVEFDVMLSADGAPLLIHDETVDRSHVGYGRVAALDAAAIRGLDAGSRHHPGFAGCRTPLLSEALDLCQRAGLWANIEIKPAQGKDEPTGRTVGELLEARASYQGVISSFSPAALTAARACHPGGRYALLIDAWSADWRQRMASCGATALHLAAELLKAERGAALGDIPWACYTVNRRDDADRLFALGCRAVFTDRPDLWQAVEM